LVEKEKKEEGRAKLFFLFFLLRVFRRIIGINKIRKIGSAVIF